MSWRSRMHPSGIKIPACPSKGMVTIQKTLQPTCPERPCAPNHGRVSCWLQGHPEVPIAPAVGTGEHTRELEVVRPWLQGLSHCPGKVCSFSLAGGWMLQLLLVIWLGFSGFSWHYPLCPGSDSISVVLRWLWGWWGEDCGSVTDYGEPKINPLWKVLGISYCDSSFWAQAGTMFQLWFMWVELLLFAAFQQRGLEVCGFWTSFDEGLFSPLGDKYLVLSWIGTFSSAVLFSAWFLFHLMFLNHKVLQQWFWMKKNGSNWFVGDWISWQRTHVIFFPLSALLVRPVT